MNYLGSQILGGSADGRGFVLQNVHSGKSEIGYFNVPVGSYQNILRLEVPVDYVLGVEVLQSQDQLAGVKPGVVLGEPLHLWEEIEELSSGTVLQNEVEFFLVLKREEEFD